MTNLSPRARWRSGLAMLVIIALGLASRRYRSSLPPLLDAYAGDTLWALAAFLLGAMLWPGAKTWALALGSGAFALAVECSQLYHAPWIDGLRAQRLVGLIIGFDFVRSDLACYAIGVALGVGWDVFARRAWDISDTMPLSSPRR